MFHRKPLSGSPPDGCLYNPAPVIRRGAFIYIKRGKSRTVNAIARKRTLDSCASFRVPPKTDTKIRAVDF